MVWPSMATASPNRSAARKDRRGNGSMWSSTESRMSELQDLSSQTLERCLTSPTHRSRSNRSAVIRVIRRPLLPARNFKRYLIRIRPHPDVERTEEPFENVGLMMYFCGQDEHRVPRPTVEMSFRVARIVPSK